MLLGTMLIALPISQNAMGMILEQSSWNINTRIIFILKIYEDHVSHQNMELMEQYHHINILKESVSANL